MQFRIAAVLANTFIVSASFGCVGDVSGSRSEPPDAQVTDEAALLFTDEVMPELKTVGCVACHVLEENSAFLAGDDPETIRQQLLDFSPAVVNLEAPASSRLLTKGVHSGPALSATSTDLVLRWIELEKDKIPGAESREVLQTTPLSPQFCTEGEPGTENCPINSIELSELGSPGSALTFVAEELSTGLYLSEITLSGGDEGAYIEHPLFLSWPQPEQKLADEFDRFFSIKLNVAAGETSTLGGGTAVFVAFGPDKPVSVAFRVVEPHRAEDPGGGGGCRDLDAFLTSARAPLEQSCASCHGGGQANAQNAMNLAGLSGDADLETACNEVLLKSDLDTPENSSIFVATDPGEGAAHPFKFGGNAANHAAFEASVTEWINLEKTAP